MEHIEFLKKASTAKKHQKECVIRDTKNYTRVAMIGVFGQFVSIMLFILFPDISIGVIPLIINSSLLIIGSVFFMAGRAEKSIKNFNQEFPEEAKLIALSDQYNRR